MAGAYRADLPALAPVRERSGRREIDELLDVGTRQRVCVVIGAAGWGKTTAVASWTSEAPTAWVRYTGHEPGGLVLQNLYDALKPHVCAPVPERWPRQRGSERIGSDVAALCDWLRAYLTTDLVLVVDDLQELQAGSHGAQLVEGVCRHAPARLHVVLMSRREPPFSLERLRGQGLVTEISAAELAFDVALVADLLHRTLGEVSSDLVTSTWQRTGGWPVAVAAAVDALRDVEPDRRPEVLERLSRPGERLHTYLTEEVVGVEPPAARELLRRLAVVGGHRSAAGITSGIDGAADMLADLDRRGLVRRGTGDGRRWLLVPPLQDYFDHEGVLGSDDRAALHRAAARDCLASHAPADALRHLVAAGDYPECAAVLVDHGDALVSSGQIGAVLDAAEAATQHLTDPRIQLVLGHARQVRGQWGAALECFDRVGTDRLELEPALAWRLAQVGLMQGEFADIRALFGRTHFGREDTPDEVQMLALVAIARRMVGDLAGLDELALRAISAARRCREPRAWAAVHNVLMLQAGAEADRRRVEAHYANAVESAQAGDDLLELSSIRVSQASQLLELGLPREALVEAEAALGLAQRCENLFLTALAHTARGRANARLGALEPTLVDVTTAIELFGRMSSRFLAWPLCALGDVHRMRGQLARARAAYEEALALAEPGHDVLGLGSALIGLARVRAADDLDAARALADRAVALGERLREVPALLTRGWVALLADDRPSAAADAARAGAAARMRRDRPGLAEAIMLSVLASAHDGADHALLGEAIEIWQESGCRVEEAAARITAGRVGASVSDLRDELAHQTLRECGIDVTSPRAAGPLAAAGRAVPSVSIRTMGVFQVYRDGVPVVRKAWQSRKARDLLKLVVARRRPVTREQLMELLWPDANPTKSGNRLSVLLTTVRDVLQPARNGDGPLVSDGHTVWLDPHKVTVDVELFLTQARDALDAHGRDAPDATARMLAVESMHTGQFLEDDPYQEWAQPLTEEVEATYVGLLRALVVRMVEAGDVDAVLRFTLRILTRDGYDERAHLDLVTALLGAGRFGEARRRYLIYARRMKEIGVDPDPMPRVHRIGGEERGRA